MKGLILAATVSAALGFTYSALTAGPPHPPQPTDPPCNKSCGTGKIVQIGATIEDELLQSSVTSQENLTS